MSAVILLPIAAVVAVVAAAGGKDKGDAPTGGVVPEPTDVPHTVTGTVGPIVYTLEKVGDDYRWSFATGEAGVDNSAKAAIRTLFETALAMPSVRPSDGVTGAAGPYTFAVTATGDGWRWTGSDLGGGGAATAEQDTSSSRGLGILAALSWLKKHGALDWIATPSKINEPPAVGGGAPDDGVATPTGPIQGTAGAAQEGPFPGLAVRADGTVSVVSRDAWQAFARPIIRGVLEAGGPASVGDLAGAVFGEVPGANITFSGKSRASTWAAVGDALAKIKGGGAYVPEPDEWLADLIVGRSQKYPGVAQTYLEHVLVARPAGAGFEWLAWKGARGFADAAVQRGPARTRRAALAAGKAWVASTAPKAPAPGATVQPKPACKTKPATRTGSTNLASPSSWINPRAHEVDLIDLDPAVCRRFRVVVATCIRTRGGATYGLMDLAAHGWPPVSKPGSWKLQPSYPEGFEGFGISAYEPGDAQRFLLPSVWKSTLRTTVTIEPAGGNVAGWTSEASTPIAVGGLDACPSTESRSLGRDVQVEGTDGVSRPWSRPQVEVVTSGRRVRARVTYQGLPVFQLVGRRGLAIVNSNGGRLRLDWKVWAIGEE